MWEARDRWVGRGDLAVRHVVGDRDWPDRPAWIDAPAAGADPVVSPGNGLDYRAVVYEQDMATALCAADVVLSRAGASTVAELASVGVGSILVPLPIATGDHQTANARVLVEAGAAVLIPDAELDAERLVTQLDALLDGPGTLAAMAVAATTVGRPDAADRVADLLIHHARAAWETSALRSASAADPSAGPTSAEVHP